MAVSAALRNTLGNREWFNANRDKLRELFPMEWTHGSKVLGMPFLFQLKLLGVDWQDESDVPRILEFLTRTGVVSLNRATGEVRRGLR